MSKGTLHLMTIIKTILFHLAIWGMMLPIYAQGNFGSLTVEDGLSDGTVQSIFRDRQGYVWLGTMRGIDRFDGSRIVNIPFDKTNVDDEEIQIVSIREEDYEHLMVMSNHGTWLLDKRHLTLSRIKEADDESLPITSKTDIKNINPRNTRYHFRFDTPLLEYFDEMGTFWRSYHFFGLDYSYETTSIFHTFSLPTGWTSEGMQVRSFLLDGPRVLLGTRQGIYVVNTQTNEVRNIGVDQIGASIVTQMKRIGNRYYVATVGNGIRIFDSSTWKSLGCLMDGAAVYQLVEHGDELWACTSKGVACWNKDGMQQQRHFTVRNSQLPDDEVFCMGFDASGHGWVSTRSGMCIYDPVSQSMSVKGVPKKVKALGMLRSITMWNDGRLLFVPQTGVPTFYSLNHGKTQPLLSIDHHATCLGIMPLGAAKDSLRLVVSANRLLLSQKNQGIRRFGYLDGLPNEQFQSNAFCLDNSNRFWVATNGGLVYANVNDIIHHKHRPIPIILQQIQTDHWFTDVEVNEVNMDSTLTLSSHDNAFTVSFTPLLMGNTRDMQFRYLLEGCDKKWKIATHDRRIAYSQLSPGSYILRIEAIGMPEINASIRVRVPLTTMAWLLMGIGLLLLGLLAHVAYCMYYKKEYFWQRLMPKPEKYQKSKIDKQELDEMAKKLLSVMESDKPYLRPDLQTNDLAKAIGCSPHVLSQLLTQQLGRTYYDFIAEYRVNEFKRLARLPEYERYTISALSELCGFRSRNPFLVAFKKYTGMSPKEWMKEAKSKGDL